MREPDRIRGQHYPHLERSLPAQAFLAHLALDLLLRGDADLLQELADRHVEVVFVHLTFLSTSRWPRLALERESGDFGIPQRRAFFREAPIVVRAKRRAGELGGAPERARLVGLRLLFQALVPRG